MNTKKYIYQFELEIKATEITISVDEESQCEFFALQDKTVLPEDLKEPIMKHMNTFNIEGLIAATNAAAAFEELINYTKGL